mmetsp:Transcript_20146/g.47647  ORF Transcript_20146/g.47647 Transcript_20146/m.47647 type:complete len:99 (-) Transcript_20146:105-401(-)
MKVILGCYLILVVMCRLMLRVSCDDLHWAVTMAMEDGMSILSFVMGLYVLHSSNGAPLALLAKCAAAHVEGAAAFARRSPEEGDSYVEKRFRLFSVAM